MLQQSKNVSGSELWKLIKQKGYGMLLEVRLEKKKSMICCEQFKKVVYFGSVSPCVYLLCALFSLLLF